MKVFGIFGYNSFFPSLLGWEEGKNSDYEQWE